jgi:hypothetical protein
MKTEKDFDTLYEYWAYIQGRIDARTEDISEIRVISDDAQKSKNFSDIEEKMKELQK